MSSTTTLAVIGGGPRLTYLASAFAQRRDELPPTSVSVFEPTGQFGSGWVHAPWLDRSMIMNRLAGEISFGPDRTCAGWEDRGAPAPVTLTEIAGAMAREDEIIDGYPTRRLHGIALQNAFAASAAQATATGRHAFALRPQAVDAVDATTGNVVAGDRTTSFDAVLVLTGHGSASPLHGAAGVDLVDRANAVRGLGATAIDLANAVVRRRTGDAVGPLQVVTQSGAAPWPRPVRPERVVPGLPFEATACARLLADADRPISYAEDLAPAICADMVAVCARVSGCGIGTAERLGEHFATAARRGGDWQQALRAVDATGAASILDGFPWVALDLVVGSGPRSRTWSAEESRRTLQRALRGYGVDPVVTAVETVLRDERPLLCRLAARLGADRAAAYARLVPAMNKLVNGPAPATLAAFLGHVESGAITVGPAVDHDDVPAGFVEPFRPGDDSLLSALEQQGHARVGLAYGALGRETTRIAVDNAMRLDGPAADGRIAAIGPWVDTGELLQASAMRPGCDHPVMRDLTAWLDGFTERHT